MAPFDVRFHDHSKKDKDIYTVLQPDICVICDPAKIDRRGCIGAPDIVVEVLSPSNSKMELFHKFQVYQEHKVREYWVVYPDEQCILQYLLDDGGVFVAGQPRTGENELVSDVLPGFRLNIDEVFVDNGRLVATEEETVADQLISPSMRPYQ
jgi:Uma2 family endonuclease